MTKEIINQCSRCHNLIEQKGQFWECPYCGLIYSMGFHEDGTKFTYRNPPPKDLPDRQITPRATQIPAQKIERIEIKPSQAIESEIYRESTDLDYYDNINLITLYLQKGEWEEAKDNVYKLKSINDPCSNAASAWYNMAVDRQAHNDLELIRSFSNITGAEEKELYDFFLNAIPDFRKRILDLVMTNGYVGDEATGKLLSIALPFVFNEAVYSSAECKEAVETAFNEVISHGYHQSFKFLLSHALEENEVDRYINYLEQFASRCNPLESQEYYAMIIAIDANNTAAHHHLVEADIKANSSKEKCIADFENLLKYSQTPIDDVKKFISVLLDESTTTEDKAEFMWNLLNYYHEYEAERTQAMSQYADLLLQSQLWSRAQEFYFAVLAGDTRNAKVFFNLCLVDMQARNEKELIAKDESFIGHPYYKKAFALACKTNKEYADQLERLVDSRKKRERDKAKRKKTIKILILAAVIFVVFIGSIFGFKMYNNNKKYGENNIVFTVTNKEYPYADVSPCYFILNVNVKNNSTLAVTRIDGIIRYYNSAGELLYESNVWLTGNLESKKDYNYDLEVEEYPTEETTELHNTPLSGLKITWELTQVTYENNEVKEYASQKERVIHEAGSGSKTPEQEISTKDNTQDESEENANNAQDSATNEAIISKAESIANRGDYEEAYTLLEKNGYDDTHYLYQAYKYASEGYFFDAVQLGLTVVVIPEGEESIPDNYFKVEYGANHLEKIVLPSTLKNIGKSAFYGCTKLTEINLPDGLSSIGNYAFSKCVSLKSIEIPDSVKSMGSNVFEECSGLESVSLSGSLGEIPASAFKNCPALTAVTIKDGATIIGISAFAGCSGLTNITFPESLKEIESNAFSGCTSLVEITIPSQVNLVRYSAFYNCSSLQKVHFENQTGWESEHTSTTVDVMDPQKNAKVLGGVNSSTWIRK